MGFLLLLLVPAVLWGVIGGGSSSGGGGSAADDDDILGGTSKANTIDARGGDDLVFGLGGGDKLAGSDGDDLLAGEFGFDSLSGGKGDDTLLGGEGNDSLFGGNADDLAIGGKGDDKLAGEAGNDYLIGGTGADTLQGGIGNDVIYGYESDSLNPFTLSGQAELRADLVAKYPGASSDQIDRLMLGFIDIQGTAGGDSLFGAEGDDRLFGDSGDTMSGGTGIDIFTGQTVFSNANAPIVTDFVRGVDRLEVVVNDVNASTVTIDTTTQPGDTIIRVNGSAALVLDGIGAGTVTSSDVTLVALSSLGGGGTTPIPPVVEGTASADNLLGSAAANLMFGGGAGDTLTGDDGADYLTGEAGNDLLDGGTGEDLLVGGDGLDTLQGGTEQDLLLGGASDDSLLGQGGADLLIGHGGEDYLNGGSGDDLIVGNEDPTRTNFSSTELANFRSGIAADFPTATSTQLDRIVNELNNSGGVALNLDADTLIGGLGNDTLRGDGFDIMTGGSGNDLFGVFYRQGFTAMTVTDFSSTEDRIEIAVTNPGATTVTYDTTTQPGKVLVLLNGIANPVLVVDNASEAQVAARLTLVAQN